MLHIAHYFLAQSHLVYVAGVCGQHASALRLHAGEEQARPVAAGVRSAAQRTERARPDAARPAAQRRRALHATQLQAHVRCKRTYLVVWGMYDLNFHLYFQDALAKISAASVTSLPASATIKAANNEL